MKAFAYVNPTNEKEAVAQFAGRAVAVGKPQLAFLRVHRVYHALAGVVLVGGRPAVRKRNRLQQMGGIECKTVSAELTYGTERLACCLQKVDTVWDMEWAHGVTYGEIEKDAEYQNCIYNFDDADVPYGRRETVPEPEPTVR